MLPTARFLRPTQLSQSALRELQSATTHPVTFEFLGTVLRAHFEDPKAAQFFLARYRSMESDAEPAINLYSVVCGDLGPLFWTDQGMQCHWPLEYGPRRIAFLADHVATKALFRALAGVVGFHAAAVYAGGTAAAIAARSEYGKTTTAIACARRGMPVYSDERCVVVRGLVVPFPRAINVRVDAVSLLREECVEDPRGIVERLSADEGKRRRYLTFERIFGSPDLPPPSPLGAAFFIDGRDSGARVRAIPGTDAVRLLLKDARSSLFGFARVAQIVSIIDKVPCFHLTLGTPDETACLIRATVEMLR